MIGINGKPTGIEGEPGIRLDTPITFSYEIVESRFKYNVREFSGTLKNGLINEEPVLLYDGITYSGLVQNRQGESWHLKSEGQQIRLTDFNYKLCFVSKENPSRQVVSQDDANTVYVEFQVDTGEISTQGILTQAALRVAIAEQVNIRYLTTKVKAIVVGTGVENSPLDELYKSYGVLKRNTGLYDTHTGTEIYEYYLENPNNKNNGKKKK